MIRKLLKYDIKATSRYLLPLYLLFMTITIINGFFKPFDVLESSTGFSLSILISIAIIFIYFLSIIGVLLGTLVVLIIRFQNNLLDKEGYLSFTLPVKTWQHTLSKLIMSFIWFLLSILLILASFLIIGKISPGDIVDKVTIVLGEIGAVFQTSSNIIFPLYIFVASILILLTIYNSLTVGHQFSNYKILSSFVAFFIFYFITQVVVIIVTLVYMVSTFGSISNIPTAVGTIPNGGAFLILLSTIMAVLALGHYLLMNYLLGNKLNLE